MQLLNDREQFITPQDEKNDSSWEEYQKVS